MQRMIKPHGRALIVIQTRGDNSFQRVRFIELLRKSGMSVHEESGPWDWDGLLERHVRCVPGQETLELSRTVHEKLDPFVLNVSWASGTVEFGALQVETHETPKSPNERDDSQKRFF
jgi:hypothetical protein